MEIIYTKTKISYDENQNKFPPKNQLQFACAFYIVEILLLELCVNRASSVCKVTTNPLTPKGSPCDE